MLSQGTGSGTWGMILTITAILTPYLLAKYIVARRKAGRGGKQWDYDPEEGGFILNAERHLKHLAQRRPLRGDGGSSRQCAISNCFPLCLIPPSPAEKGYPPPWETSIQTAIEVFSHVLLFSCPKCGNPLASAWLSTEKNLEGADAQRFDRKCDCGWSGRLVGAQALRHWIEPWKNPVEAEPDGPHLRRQPQLSRFF